MHWINKYPLLVVLIIRVV